MDRIWRRGFDGDRKADYRRYTALILLTHQVALTNPAVLDTVLALGVVAHTPVTLVMIGDIDQALSAANIGLGWPMPATGSSINRDFIARPTARADAVIGRRRNGGSDRVMRCAMGVAMDLPPTMAVWMIMPCAMGTGLSVQMDVTMLVWLWCRHHDRVFSIDHGIWCRGAWVRRSQISRHDKAQSGKTQAECVHRHAKYLNSIK
ncbi:MAG: hypothetical protein CMF26_06490 [Kiloniella sp.]|nr:hypothetical protein [Kiloniella sp.]